MDSALKHQFFFGFRDTNNKRFKGENKRKKKEKRRQRRRKRNRIDRGGGGEKK